MFLEGRYMFCAGGGQNPESRNPEGSKSRMEPPVCYSLTLLELWEKRFTVYNATRKERHNPVSPDPDGPSIVTSSMCRFSSYVHMFAIFRDVTDLKRRGLSELLITQQSYL
ncbi:hypothetical protein M514_02730 [Trichuris suis]|uniref:Uncharacterized protein n=1 Tax=Trichuris suis TaxID=68888 RepID=A0A085MGC9_9BILA|nr:hypothetical protein M513_02730 [Trichuris suis]KFD68796.1 hypothetical protein M514_02730 [Trichuris suis]